MRDRARRKGGQNCDCVEGVLKHQYQLVKSRITFRIKTDKNCPPIGKWNKLWSVYTEHTGWVNENRKIIIVGVEKVKRKKVSGEGGEMSSFRPGRILNPQ